MRSAGHAFLRTCVGTQHSTSTDDLVVFREEVRPGVRMLGGVGLSPSARARRPRQVRETVSLYEAKTHLSRLVDRASAGEEIIIAKSGRPRARLVPMEEARPLRVPGKGRGRWNLGKCFDEPLPDAILADFEGER